MHRLCWVDEATGWLPRIGQVVDPVALGVHAAVDEVGDGASQHSGRVPSYVPRDVDQALDDVLSRGGFALLVGDSTSGKSRAAYEAMRRLPAHWSVLVPRDGRALRELFDDGLDLKQAVVWLDDLERFLGAGGLDVTLLRRVRGDESQPVAVLATMRANELAARLPDPTHPVAAEGVLESDQQVLLAAQRLPVPRALSEAERARARDVRRDGQIERALAHLDRFGLGEYLAAGPRSWRIWQQGRREPSSVAEAVGAALVAAAIDCRRAGLIGAPPEELLTELVGEYLPDDVDTAAVQAGLRWATATQDNPAGLLRVQFGGLASFDYLLDQVQRDPRTTSVPQVVWERLVSQAEPDRVWHIGMAAYWAGRLDVAERAFHLGLDADDAMTVRRAALGLSDVANLLDQFAEAKWWLGYAADVTARANAHSAVTLQERSDLAASERWYRRVAGIDTGPGDMSDAESPGQLIVEHEHAAMDYETGRYIQRTTRRLTNHSGRVIDRYPIRVAVERFPYDAEQSRRHYRDHPLRVEDLQLWAECDGRPMIWELAQDLDNFKEIWLLFENSDQRFAIQPGATVQLRYGYAVPAELWGPWSQRPVRVPTRRLTVSFSFPQHRRPRLSGFETALQADATPLPVAQHWHGDQTVFTWERVEPPLNARYRFEWQFDTVGTANGVGASHPSHDNALPGALRHRLPDALPAAPLAELVRQFCALGSRLPDLQPAIRADALRLEGVEWQLEQDMLSAVRDTLGPVPVLAEEYFHRFGTAAHVDDTSRIRLVLDPLDGSNSFQRGEPTYTCTFALWVDEHLTFGVIYQPAEQRLYLALRGHTPYVNGQKMTVLPAQTERTVAIKSTVSHDPVVSDLRTRLEGRGYRTEHVESSALKLCWTAEGRRAGVIKRIGQSREMPLEWGVAAGMLVCHGAGRAVRTWNGSPWKRTHPELLVADLDLLSDLHLS
jgi:fructose-1,6-bisphosphatase/inositol monophosphatase family enzyme